MSSKDRFRIAPNLPAVAAPRVDRATLDAAIARVVAKIDSNLPRWRDRFPSSASTNGQYEVYRQSELSDGNAWTSGFWPGLLWLAYQATDDARFRNEALRYVEIFSERLEKRLWVDHHDIGFLYSPSCVAAYKLTGQTEAKNVALRAADLMLERYQVKGRFIQAWGPMNDRGAYRLIIDSLMNLPLLYWASETTGDARYRVAAEAHLRTTLAHTIRADASTFHTFYFDPDTGAPLHGVTRQGFSDSSCWARGQAWAVYGIPLSARYVSDSSLSLPFTRVTDYFLGHLPADKVCYWDLVFTEGDQERDSSAAAIAVCGLLESLQHCVPDSLRDRYETAAHEILLSLIERYAADERDEGLLLHAVYSKPHDAGVDECCIWGDYFYFEALLRLRQDWTLHW